MLLNFSDEDSWVLWTSRRSNQSILKELDPEYSLEGLMLKLKLQYPGHPMQRTNSFEKTLVLRRLRATGEEVVGWHHQLTGREFELGILQSMGLQRVRYNLATKQQPFQMQACTSAYLNKQVTLIQVLWIRVICGSHPDLTQSIESNCLSSGCYKRIPSTG